MEITSKDIYEYEKYLFKEDKAQATIYKYVEGVKHLAKWIKENNITKENLIEYRNQLRLTHNAKTVNGRISAINSFLVFKNRSDLKIKFLKVQSEPFIDDEKEISQKEYKRLLQAARTGRSMRLYYILLTLGSTGIRISELPFITVQAVEDGKANIMMKGKCRRVILNSELCKKLKEYIFAHKIIAGSIFCTKTGRPVDRSNIFHEMKKLYKKAKVDRQKIFPHNLRHLFARTYFEIEKNISYLADILGHSRIETTRIYIATTASFHRKTLNKMKLVI